MPTLKLKEIKNSDGRELNLMATRNYNSSTVTHMRSHNKWTEDFRVLIAFGQLRAGYSGLMSNLEHSGGNSRNIPMNVSPFFYI